MSDVRRSFFDKTFKDHEGNWGLAAAPNLPIIIWFVAMIVSFFVTGTAHTVVSTLQRGALFTWAWLELFQGVNYFRRALGLLVLIYILWSGAVHNIIL